MRIELYQIKPRIILILFSLSLCGNLSNAQSISVVDSFQYYVRSIHSANELAPLSEDDPNYKEPEAELTLVIYLKNISNIDTLNVDLGNQQDMNDIRGWKYELVNEGSVLSFKLNGKLFPVNNGKVVVTQKVPISIYSRKMHLRVYTKDKNVLESAKKYKELH